MKIVHTVESYLPLKHGMSEVVSRLSEWLVKQGHEVIVATSYCEERESDFINGVEIRSFKIQGNLIIGISGDTESYISFLKNEEYDILTNFAAQQWATDLCLNILPQIKAKKFFVPTGFSQLFNPLFKEYYEKMKTWMKEYDTCIFLSNHYRDIRFAREYNVQKCTVIPNGASLEEFIKKPSYDIRNKLSISNDTILILHVGSYTTVKGHDEALDIFLESNIKNAVLIFAGQNFDTEESLWFSTKLNWFKGLVFKKFYRPVAIKQFFRFLRVLIKKGRNSIYTLALNREELVALYHTADILLFPSLIECSPVVLFEAMASKTPFLVTNVGNTAEIIEWSGSGRLLPTDIDEQGLSRPIIESSAKILQQFVASASSVEQLAEIGYKRWIEKFTWEGIAQQYEKLYLENFKK